MARVEICEHCGRKIKVGKDFVRGSIYICEECEAMITGRKPYVIWLDKKAAELRN